MTSPPPEHAGSPQQQAELQAMRTMLTFSEGTFSLSFAICNSPALRDFLIDRLHSDRPGLRVHTISPGCTDILDEAISSVGQANISGLFLAGLESCVSSGQANYPILRALNASREAWARKFPCPVVFWVPEYVIRILYCQARDLMAWRSHQFEFGSEPADLARADAIPIMSDSLAINLSLEDKQFRIAELESRISQAGADIPVTLVPHVVTWMLELATLRQILGDLPAAREELDKAVHLLDRPLSQGATEDNDQCGLRAVAMGKIADILQRRGETDEALRTLREEELPVYERLGDVRSRAVTMGRIADILQQRGETDEALRIRREEELPVYERLGDVRERAITMGKIADILQQRGETDEALRIRREEELPAFERLGDVRSHAVTMGKIADILQQRGETDEALRIRREEQLPVYERLGDVRERAVTMDKIADILQQRGETDEALRTLREEVLPAFERLGDVRSLLVGRANLAIVLRRRGKPGDRAEAGRLLELALAAARKLGIPEAKVIEERLASLG